MIPAAVLTQHRDETQAAAQAWARRTSVGGIASGLLWEHNLRFSSHYLELDIRFATAGERDLLTERQIPLQRIMIAVRQFLLAGQRQHQVAAGGEPLERSLGRRIR